MRMRWAALALLGLGVGLTAVVVPQAEAQQTAADPLDRYYGQRPMWQRCDPQGRADYECATVKVPLDYRAPGGATIDLAVSRIRTATPDRRRGVLLSNPGGPGNRGLGDPLAFDELLPTEVREQYDLIGFDPRGLGKSTPIACGLAAAEREFPRPYATATFGQTSAAARRFADTCAVKVGARLPYMTTRNTARDMDVIRGVLGEPKISYWGMSYGTYLGAVFMQMFPNRSDRMILDSSVDPALAWRGIWRSQAPASEAAFEDWTRWTAQQHQTYGLGSTPAAVRQAFYNLVAQADRQPIRYSDGALTGAQIRVHLRETFFNSPGTAAERVAQLRRDASGASGPRPSWTLVADNGDNNDSLFWAVNCNDAAWPRAIEQYRRDAVRDLGRFPLYGDVPANVTPCAFWKPRNIEPATTIDNAVPALMLHNQWDAATPLSSGLDMHRVLTGSRLVYVEGGRGHIVLVGGPPCAISAAYDYLETGRLPTRDLTCQAVPPTGLVADDSRR